MMEKDELITIVTYQDSLGFLELNTGEYSKTIQTTSELDFISFTRFVHPHKSISTSRFVKGEAGILAFKSSLTTSSSGGPVINRNGQIIGIAFGNFKDIEIQDYDFMGDDILFCNIDIRENSHSFKLSKNVNLAVSTDNNFLQSSSFFSKVRRTPKESLQISSITRNSELDVFPKRKRNSVVLEPKTYPHLNQIFDKKVTRAQIKPKKEFIIGMEPIKKVKT